jgi:cytidylate kinase
MGPDMTGYKTSASEEPSGDLSDGPKDWPSGDLRDGPKDRPRGGPSSAPEDGLSGELEDSTDKASSFAALAALIRSRPARLGAVRLVAIDGPSGAGKTWFADRLAKELDAPVVHTDDLLDGWDDQFTFWPRLEELVLGPLRDGRAARYQRYQWDRRCFGGPPVRIEPADAVLMEGVSSARSVIRAELSYSIFISAPADLRLSRALAREGGDDVAFRAYLERWRLAEDRHFAGDGIAEAADLVVDGAAEGPDDRYEQLCGGRRVEPRSLA